MRSQESPGRKNLPGLLVPETGFLLDYLKQSINLLSGNLIGIDSVVKCLLTGLALQIFRAFTLDLESSELTLA
jgi:hypothetical protein